MTHYQSHYIGIDLGEGQLVVTPLKYANMIKLNVPRKLIYEERRDYISNPYAHAFNKDMIQVLFPIGNRANKQH